MDFRKISNLFVNCVVFSLHDSGINVLLSKRDLKMYDDKYPDIDDWILVGDRVLKTERLDKSAERIFTETTGLTNSFKTQFRVFGNPERVKGDKDILWLNSKGIDTRIFSVVYYFVIPELHLDQEYVGLKWFPITELPKLGFDHNLIVTRCFGNLKERVLNEPVIFEFLNDKFTLNELHFAYESVLETKIDNRNFRKKALNNTYIIPIDETRRTKNSKKPSKLYVFSRDIYDKIVPQDHIINV